MDKAEIADSLIARLRTLGHAAYFGENVSTLDHMRQTATGMAAARPGDASAITAALLHDIGHLLHDLGEDIAYQGVDSRHEQIGADYLSRWFSPAVTEPVRLHVDAKRYLCAVDPAYQAGLSTASVRSLALQGGPMDPAEAAAFAARPHADVAIMLRRCDDQGKLPDSLCLSLEDLRPVILEALAH